MTRFLRYITIALALAAVVSWKSTRAQPSVAAKDSIASRHYCFAEPGYRYEFPRDHFSHECYRTEWWYFTGNLTASDGRRFGYQLTFFREGVDNPYPNPSRWRVDDLYLAHFAISDLDGKSFFHTQKMSRAGIALAGVDPAQGRIWNAPWKAEVHGNSWTLEAEEGGHEIHLQLDSQKPPTIQGVDGISQKGEAAGNASHYYSLTRLETRGQIRVNGESMTASGLSWMDHEFSTSALEPDQAGWDWVSLQMDDGTDWMFYQLRRKDGSRDPHTGGSFVDEKGRAVILSAQDFEMTPEKTTSPDVWTSSASGARYPIHWHIRVPREGLDLEVTTPLAQQELITKETTGISYWEGSITSSGTRGGKKIQGRGYLEMTGYAGPMPASLYSGASVK